MTRVLVFQHLAAEGPGRFEAMLAADGVSVTTVRFWLADEIPALEDFDQLWVMGGDMDVWDVDIHPWLVAEKRAIRRWIGALARPYLGICLGHQLAADALGGTCGPQRPVEIGVGRIELTPQGQRDPLFAGLPPRFEALQWHGVRVAQPPDGASVLAGSQDCRCQALAFGPRAYGLQFHVEAQAPAVREWGCVSDYRAMLDRELGPGGFDRLEADFARSEGAFQEMAQRLYRNFMTLAAA